HAAYGDPRITNEQLNAVIRPLIPQAIKDPQLETEIKGKIRSVLGETPSRLNLTMPSVSPEFSRAFNQAFKDMEVYRSELLGLLEESEIKFLPTPEGVLRVGDS